MFGTTWRASERAFDVVVERDVAVPVGDGVDPVGDCFRPETDEPVSATRSTPWRAHRPHAAAEPVEPGAVVRYRIDVLPIGAVLEPGERVGLRITSADVHDVGEVDIAVGRIRETYALGRHLSRQSPSRVTVYHDDSRPSSLVLPVVEGNVMGTYRSGGGPVAFDERAPYGLIQADERRAG